MPHAGSAIVHDFGNTITKDSDKASLFVTGPAKTGNVGTNYIASLYRSYLSGGTEYLYFFTCIIKLIKFVLDAQNCIAIV